MSPSPPLRTMSRSFICNAAASAKRNWATACNQGSFAASAMARIHSLGSVKLPGTFCSSNIMWDTRRHSPSLGDWRRMIDEADRSCRGQARVRHPTAVAARPRRTTAGREPDCRYESGGPCCPTRHARLQAFRCPCSAKHRYRRDSVPPAAGAAIRRPRPRTDLPRLPGQEAIARYQEADATNTYGNVAQPP